jgi:competence ComEA-like helix-hairpin-helix protein
MLYNQHFTFARSEKRLTSDSFLVLLLCFCGLLSATGCVRRERLGPSTVSGNPVAAAIPQANLAPVDINSANAGELQRLPGIGKVLAARIVAHREQYGRFRRAEHLMMVRGISERKFREMRALITVE